MWDDVVVQRLGLAMLVLAIGGLLTFITMIINGVVPLNAGPQTMETATVLSQEQRAGERHNADTWAGLILAYINADRLTEARQELMAAQAATLDHGYEYSILYAEGRLLIAEERYDEALQVFRDVEAKTNAAFVAELERGGEKNWALSSGPPENYYNALLGMIHIYLIQDQKQEVLDLMDKYLAGNPYSGGILIDRGNLKLAMGDFEGAKSDFESALQYLPDSQEALDGLEKAEGSTQ